MVLYHSRLHPVWQQTAEGPTPGRSSLTFTWRPRQTTASSPTRPSAMPPTPSHSLPRGSGVSTPPATCDAHASRGLALACCPGRQTQQRPPGFPMPRAPPQNAALAPLLPLSARQRAAKLERGATFQLRVITSACRCSPSPRRRTGSLWSLLSTCTRRLPPPR